MTTKIKKQKLKKTIAKLRHNLTLQRSDYLIELDGETYRANFAEQRFRTLAEEVARLKAQLAKYSQDGTILPIIPDKSVSPAPVEEETYLTETPGLDKPIRFTPRYPTGHPTAEEIDVDISAFENEGGAHQ
jgi:hypothetical protein